MTKPAVAKLKPWDVPKLRRLFRQGLYGDFKYFPVEYLQQTDHANRLLRLFAASLNPRRFIYVAKVDQTLVGYAISGRQNNHEAFLFWLYVQPQHRGSSLGRQLLESTVRQLRNHDIRAVALATHDYANYYKKFGFINFDDEMFVIGKTNMYIMKKEL